MHPRKLFFTVTLAAVAAARAAEPVASADGVAFFEKKIRPLLVEHCLDCHSPEHKIKGELRLDTRAGWQAGGELGEVILPGKPEASLLVKAVRYADTKLQMPPKRKLSDAQITDLEAWIKMGAPDPRTGAAVVAKKKSGMDLEAGRKFWSFQPIKKVAPPEVKDSKWARTDIDRFILAKQEGQGIKPAGDASRESLIRRAYFSLVGLPPTPDQIDTFLNDARPDAFERVVDSLLASPHFGERWGRHWLDVARFAESSGGGRTLLFKDAWRYRDYVIESFNADVPFDRFVREQIAGDLLPAVDNAQRRRQLTATAFLSLGPTNYEEQDKRQLRFDVIDEQLDTLGKSLLGMTIGCARCHDHKFDPIPQKDYYALAGIFASTRTLFNYTDNVARWIDAPLPMDGAKEGELRAHETKVELLKAQLESAKKESKRLLADVAKATDKTIGKPVAAASLGGIIVDDAEAKIVGDWRHSKFARSYIGEGYLEDRDAGKGEKTLTFVPPIPKSGRYEVRLAYTPLENRATNTPVTVFHADGEQTIYLDQKEAPAIAGRFVSLGQFRFEKDGAGYVLISNEGTKGHVVADAVQFLPVEELAKDPVAAAMKDNKEYRKADTAVRDLEKQLKKLAAEGPQRVVAMAVREGDEEEIRDTEIRVRGLVQNKGASVPRGFLQVATHGQATAISEKESGRRELAEWLVSPENPLTARVTANRIWHWLFGAGLVRTTDNFGVTGEPPSHPELLDHLAVRFIEQGWSVKKLVREIVLSHAWQISAGGAEPADPDNRLLTHFPRQRLDAEEIRDAMLAVGGKLDLRLGGPNILGAGGTIIDANNSSAQNTEYAYVYADTRRSVYTPAFRAKRLELFEVFDFGNINQPLGQRNVSTVAPQALYLLNSPFVLEQAKFAAEHSLADSKLDDAARLDRAYRLALGRRPTKAERETMVRFLGTVGADSGDDAKRLEAWAHLFQALFACVDFRYLD
ncbi:MAG: DUF1553 domain-containing protein [Verrucomicrobia bacterium]|nr:DUF1553 domain-containing protein [Verrucomicrobiota bacterium]